MSTRHRFLLFLGIILLVGACSSNREKTDYRTDYDFSQLKSFALLPVDKSVYSNPKVSQIEVDRVGKLLSGELQKRYQKVDKSLADFYVRYFVVVEERMKVDTYNASYGMYPYGYGYHFGMHAPQTRNTYYQQGSIIVDIIDAKSQDVVWRGSTEAKVTNQATPQEREARVSQYLMELFGLFPPAINQ